MTRDRAMRRQRRPLAVGGACLLGGVLLCFAAPVSEARAQSPLPDASSASVPPKPPATTLSGTLDIEGTLKVNTGLPAGTKLSINAFAQVSNKAFTDTDSVGRSASVTVSGGQVIFKLLMPYTWPGVVPADPVSVNVTVSASAAGKGGISLSYQSFLTRKVPLPKDGVTTKVIFTGSL